MDTRLASEIVERREVIDYLLSRLNTNCPGVIEAFDPATQTATVRPAIMMKVIVDGVTSYLAMPQILKAPVAVPMAAVAGFALTLPVSAGDPCLIHFSQRCIDNWLQHGGVQPPEDTPGSARHHALTDAIVTLAPTPLTQVLTDWLTNGIELRNRDRSVRITLTDSGIEVAGAVSFLGDVAFHGAMVDRNGIDLTLHKHGGVQTGAGQTGVPL